MFIFFLLAAFFFLRQDLPAQEVRQTWTFHHSPKELSALFQQIDLPEELFYTTLEKNQIQVVFSLETPNQQPISLLPKEDFLESSLLWEDPWTEVRLPLHPRVPHHVWIVLKQPVGSFLETSSDQLVHLNDTFRKVIGILHHFGISQYVLGFSNLPQKNQLLLEIIPPRPDAQDALDFEDKIGCNSYVVMRGQAPSLAMAFSKEEIQNFANDWRTAFLEHAEPSPEFSTVETGIHTHKRRKMAYLVENLFLALQKKGISLNRTIHSETISPDEVEIKLPKKPCVFCDSETLEKQSTFEHGSLRVLYNHKPFVRGAHFLVTPTRHCKRFIDLTAEERISMFEMAKSVIRAMEIAYGRSDAKIYLQEGFSVGQTVFHSHLHVLLTPDPARHLFFSLSYENFPPEDPASFLRVRNLFNPLLQTILSRQ